MRLGASCPTCIFINKKLDTNSNLALKLMYYLSLKFHERFNWT